jgi:hypothetical protein
VKTVVCYLSVLLFSNQVLAQSIATDPRTEWETVTARDFIPYSGISAQCHILYESPRKGLTNEEFEPITLTASHRRDSIRQNIRIQTSKGLAELSFQADFVVVRNRDGRPAAKIHVIARHNGNQIETTDLGPSNRQIQVAQELYVFLFFENMTLSCNVGH